MQTSTTTIRPASPADLAHIASLLRAASLPTDSVESARAASQFLIAERGGQFAGAICMEDYGDAALLRSLVVEPDQRSFGVGTELVRGLLGRASAGGKRSVFLLTTNAESFFERMGFSELSSSDLPATVKQSGEFAGCCAAGATAMELKVGAEAGSADLRDRVRKKYGDVAKRAQSSCCAKAPDVKTQVTAELYSESQQACLPTTAVNGSRGCGSPTDRAELLPGDVVLDLGSGAGADVFLAATKVGPQGKVYGLDMTPNMVEVAREGQRELGIENVQFLLGEMEHIPLADKTVDVVISNCVISLVEDKDLVFKEIARVLRPGGRICLSDIVSSEPIPVELRGDLNLWLGCLGGALEQSDYERRLRKAGFVDPSIEITRVYDLPNLLRSKETPDSAEGLGRAERAVAAWKGQLFAATVRARRLSDSTPLQTDKRSNARA